MLAEIPEKRSEGKRRGEGRKRGKKRKKITSFSIVAGITATMTTDLASPNSDKGP